ncbi:hypothetical protein THAOC_27707, partial [Thalassiosira oceanica]
MIIENEGRKEGRKEG